MIMWLRYKWWRFCKWVKRRLPKRGPRQVWYLGRLVVVDNEIIGYMDDDGRIRSIDEVF